MPPAPTTLRNSNCRIIIGIMIGWPHFLHGSVAKGARSPGIKTFASHHPQVTIRSVSLMFQSIYHHPVIRQAEKTHFNDLNNHLTNTPKWCFFPAVEHEKHV